MIRHAVVLIIIVECFFCSSLSDERMNVDLPEVQGGIANASVYRDTGNVPDELEVSKGQAKHDIANSPTEERETDDALSERDGRSAVTDSECYTLADGSDYRGKVSETTTGRTCQKWTDQTPHQHTKTPETFPDAGLGDHNYCRNPTRKSKGAWCYTTDAEKKTQFCNIGKKKKQCSEPQAKSGVVFTRWGHSSCPALTTLVYSGIMAGKYYNSKGGGTSFLCLPDEPKEIDGSIVNGIQSSRGYLYHTQYQSADGPFSGSKRFHDVPCAVCLDPYRSNSILYPARDDCPIGWTREYYGYLMTAHYSYYATEFICVDEAGESIRGTATNVYGALIYPVETVCATGSGLPCGPYVNGNELSCAICAK